MYDRIIEDMVVLKNADPNRVYLLGYSAGGDAVYQIAPRMADRWASACMCAGHPNGAGIINLAHVAMLLQVGEMDFAFNRNIVAIEYGDRLKKLQN